MSYIKKKLIKKKLIYNFLKISNSFLFIPKKLFLNFFMFKKKINLAFVYSYLRNKMFSLCLSHTLIDKFNLPFFVTLYNSSSIFKSFPLKQDLYYNIGLVKK